MPDEGERRRHLRLHGNDVVGVAGIQIIECECRDEHGDGYRRADVEHGGGLLMVLSDFFGGLRLNIRNLNERVGLSFPATPSETLIDPCESFCLKAILSWPKPCPTRYGRRATIPSDRCRRLTTPSPWPNSSGRTL